MKGSRTDQRAKVVLSAGGTGGHLFAAQSLAQDLAPLADILFVAGKLSGSDFFNRGDFCFEEIEVSAFNYKKPLSTCHKLTKGFLQSLAILKRYKPDLVIGFGSYFTFPLLAASTTLRCPFILHEQNCKPGRVNRLFSKHAQINAITYASSKTFLRGPTVEVAMPLRWHKVENKEEAYRYFDLDPDKKTLLIFGGSQGANGINHLALKLMKYIALPIQILHFVGPQKECESIINFYREKGCRYCVKPFENRMDLAFSIADVALTRAGAATIAELIEWRLPAILIPFPAASENHQEYNAHFFVNEAQGGYFFTEKSASLDQIAHCLDGLLGTDGEKKRSNLDAYNRRKIKRTLSNLIIDTLKI